MAAHRYRLYRLAILQACDRTASGSRQESGTVGPVYLNASPGEPRGLVSASVRRVARWREMAADLTKKHPHRDCVRIAQPIQESKDGKQRGLAPLHRRRDREASSQGPSDG